MSLSEEATRTQTHTGRMAVKTERRLLAQERQDHQQPLEAGGDARSRFFPAGFRQGAAPPAPIWDSWLPDPREHTSAVSAGVCGTLLRPPQDSHTATAARAEQTPTALSGGWPTKWAKETDITSPGPAGWLTGPRMLATWGAHLPSPRACGRPLPAMSSASCPTPGPGSSPYR